MDDLVVVVKDLQPAAFIVVAVAAVALASNLLDPRIGPWVALLTVAGVTVHVGNRVLGVEDRPAWLLPLALAGLLLAAVAGLRLWKAIHARSNRDLTIGYVFLTALAIVGLWLSIALIDFDATQAAAAITG